MLAAKRIKVLFMQNGPFQSFIIALLSLMFLCVTGILASTFILFGSFIYNNLCNFTLLIHFYYFQCSFGLQQAAVCTVKQNKKYIYQLSNIWQTDTNKVTANRATYWSIYQLKRMIFPLERQHKEKWIVTNFIRWTETKEDADVALYLLLEMKM